jgi:hypothetical protein
MRFALPAAGSYAKIAPSSPHVLHMRSHIFTRLGLWQESIESNIAFAADATNHVAAHGRAYSFRPCGPSKALTQRPAVRSRKKKCHAPGEVKARGTALSFADARVSTCHPFHRPPEA